MKQLSSILFSFTAIVVILAHSVTPHHFHEDKVYIEFAFNTEENLSQDKCCHSYHKETATHNHSEEEHHHDAKDSTEKCILSKLDFVISNQIKTDCKSFEYKGFYKNNISVQDLPGQLYNIQFLQNESLFSNHPLIIQLKISLTRDHGFRAPPLA